MRDTVLYGKMKVLGQSPCLAFFHLEGDHFLSDKCKQDSYISLLFDTKLYSPGTSGF